ncbi:helix-turn-helix domain-containing protein [Zooshikella sp. RANM57]|uniref:helix-turn-helix domain-containing protein n=1 Tax=Zooshikella sp. RANM57 TaxID=3425863 RepID=UPI003D6F8CC9
MKEISIGPTLKRIRLERGLTLKVLSRLTDDKIEASNISRIENEKTGTTLDTLTVIAKALGTTASEIVKEAEGGQQVIAKPQQITYIPVLSWSQIDHWNEIKSKEIDSKAFELWLEAPRGSTSNAYGLIVTGDSMQAMTGYSFHEGCSIVVDPDKQADNHSFVIAKVTDNSYVFKQLVIDGPYRYLKSLNNSYKTIDVTTETLILGVVTAWGYGYTVNNLHPI